MKRILIALLAVVSVSTGANAQEWCGSSINRVDNRTRFPHITDAQEANMLELLNNSYVESVTPSGDRSGTYIIPVVFHVLHMYGSENIDDQRIYDLLEELNLDYSGSHPSLSNVIPEMQSRIGNANIEFRLAAKTPTGECTNGIEHIVSHETFVGDMLNEAHKIRQWNHSRYLNIWIVEEPGDIGPGSILMGYSTFPFMADGIGAFTDGIVMRNSTIQANENRVVAHEVGHYFGLCHSFGCSAEAGDGICDAITASDYIDDTPPTDGTQGCNLYQWACDPDSIDTIANVQNIMDYSSCRINFTQGQAIWMDTTLQQIEGQRNLLWIDTTLQLTGTADQFVDAYGNVHTTVMPQTDLTVPLCVPVADFFADEQFVCAGSTVTLTDASWNAVIDNWSWNIEDATYVQGTSSTDNQVKVQFGSEGYKQVTLTVTNSRGSDSKTLSTYIYVSPDWASYNGPVTWNMEGGETDLFRMNNIEDNYASFQLVDGVGIDQSHAFKLNNYRDVSNADPFTADWWYWYRLGSSVDELVTPSVNLGNTSNINVSFKWAFAANTVNVDDLTEELRVQTSVDCGETWQTRKTISGADLLSGGFAGGIDFEPTSNNVYFEESFSLAPNPNYYKLRIKFVFTASDESNNLFIDDIKISGTLGVEGNEIDYLALNIYPNPSNGEAINVSYTASEHPVTFTVRDMSGKVLSQETVTTTNATVNHQLKNTAELPAACYFVEVSSNGYSSTKKVVVL